MLVSALYETFLQEVLSFILLLVNVTAAQYQLPLIYFSKAKKL